jgi:DNA-binding SARP family transcriptional activator
VCQRLLDLDPLHQQAYALWMQSLLEDERPQEVLRIFERARRTLSKELGCEPELALLELYQRARMKL